MPLILNGLCSELMIRAVDNLTDEQKKDRQAVYDALGSGIEQYIADLVQQLLLYPIPALQTSTSLGSPTAPGPAPVPIGLFLK